MQPYIGEKELGTAIARMERIVEIQKVLVQQVHVMGAFSESPRIAY